MIQGVDSEPDWISKMPFLEFVCNETKYILSFNGELLEDEFKRYGIKRGMHSNLPHKELFELRDHICLVGLKKLAIGIRFSTNTDYIWSPTKDLIFDSMNMELEIMYYNEIKRLELNYKLDKILRK